MYVFKYEMSKGNMHISYKPHLFAVASYWSFCKICASCDVSVYGNIIIIYTSSYSRSDEEVQTSHAVLFMISEFNHSCMMFF